MAAGARRGAATGSRGRGAAGRGWPDGVLAADGAHARRRRTRQARRRSRGARQGTARRSWRASAAVRRACLPAFPAAKAAAGQPACSRGRARSGAAILARERGRPARRGHAARCRWVGLRGRGSCGRVAQLAGGVLGARGRSCATAMRRPAFSWPGGAIHDPGRAAAGRHGLPERRRATAGVPAKRRPHPLRAGAWSGPLRGKNRPGRR